MIKPMKYKGQRKKRRYFEGWYYKSVTADKSQTVSLIPGVSKNIKDPHAFIQVIINDHHKINTEYIRYDINAFSYDFKRNVVMIDKNCFGINRIELNINAQHINIQGQIDLKNHRPIQTKIYAPSIMGFFEYLPFMECNHDVVSMNHELKGDLIINDTKINFDHGKGYIEKDYGRSFPDAYVWIQSNHFKNETISLMFSYATIPYLGFKFKGFIVNLVVDNEEYRFATYNFAKIKLLNRNDKKIAFEARKGKFKLVVYAEDKDTINLASPKEGIMNQYIKEGLSGIVRIVLSRGKQVLVDDTGENAGIEIML